MPAEQESRAVVRADPKRPRAPAPRLLLVWWRSEHRPRCCVAILAAACPRSPPLSRPLGLAATPHSSSLPLASSPFGAAAGTSSAGWRLSRRGVRARGARSRSGTLARCGRERGPGLSFRRPPPPHSRVRRYPLFPSRGKVDVHVCTVIRLRSKRVDTGKLGCLRGGAGLKYRPV